MPRNMKGYGAPREPGEALKSLKRIVKMLFKFYPVLVPVTIFCIIFSAAVSAVPAVFVQKVTANIEEFMTTGDWSAAKQVILPKIGILIVLYFFSIISMTLYQQLMAYMTQGFLNKMRCAMFDGMQDLPISYFDTHKHGDIMSYYTNDIDTLRQLVSQSLPTLIQAGSVVLFVLAIMLYYSVWLTLVVLFGVVMIMLVSGKVGGGSAKYFVRQQQSVGKQEGFVQEMMNGQKVIKVFCHEEESQADFDALNNALFEDSYRAHAYANILGPIIMNIGNVLYVVIAIVGGLFMVSGRLKMIMDTRKLTTEIPLLKSCGRDCEISWRRVSISLV